MATWIFANHQTTRASRSEPRSSSVEPSVGWPPLHVLCASGQLVAIGVRAKLSAKMGRSGVHAQRPLLKQLSQPAERNRPDLRQAFLRPGGIPSHLPPAH